MIEQGKLPPQNIDAEEAVLGAILREKGAFNEVCEILTPDSFYKERNSLIYEAIVNLSNQYKPIDLITIVQELRKTSSLEKIGGALYITSLTNRVGSSANIVSHALIVKDKYILRKLINLSSEIAKNAFEDNSNVKDIIDKIEKDFTSISNGVVKTAIKTSAQLYDEAVKNNDLLLQNKGITGVPSGLTALDKLTGGFQNTDLIILAARPGMGKTSLALNMLTNPAFKGTPTAIFSLEMNNKQLYSRVISQVTGIHLENIMRNGMNEYELTQLMAKSDLFCGSNIYFDDSPSMPLFDLRNKARRLVREKGVKLLIIDYLQLVTNETRNTNREGEISSISRGLKGLAKELNIPIIALAQLSRASEKRGVGSEPMLSDLRESGSIEQDADMVMFIHRPEYYNIMEDEQGNSTQGVASLIIAKHRNGSTGKRKARFIAQNTNFTDYEEYTTPF